MPTPRTVGWAFALALLVAGGAFVPPVGAADGWTAVVRLHADAEVMGPDISLGDIADIEADDEELRQRLLALHVGRAPLPGQRRELHLATVQTRLRQQRLPVGQIAVVADAAGIVVRTRGVTVTGEGLAAAAAAAAAEHAATAFRFAADGGRWDVACPPPGPVTVGGDEATLRVGRISGAAPGALVVQIDVVPKIGASRTVAVRCDATLAREVLVAAKALKRHDELPPDAFEKEWRTLTSVPREGLLPVEAPERWRLTRPVAPGTVLTLGMVEPKPLVVRGARVHIVAAVEGLVVTAPGVALGDGGPGEFVLVENALSGRVVEAQVVDEETVAIVWR